MHNIPRWSKTLRQQMLQVCMTIWESLALKSKVIQLESFGGNLQWDQRYI